MILLNCGICCMCFSVWGVLQLGVMGLLYEMETPILIEDTHAHPGEYTTYKEFIDKTRENYHVTAKNCWIAAGVYGVTLFLSLTCIRIANKSAAKEALGLEDDEIACAIPLTKNPEVKRKSKDDSNILT